jgi:uncharacterized membrane protein YhhN
MTSSITLNWLIGVSAVLAITASLSGHEVVFVVLKPLTTVFIITLHITYRRFYSRGMFNAMLLALLLCLAGDVFLLWDAYFVFGLSAFLIAHLLFAWVFVLAGGWHFRWLPAIALLIIGAGFYLLLLPRLEALVIPVAIYQVVICSMALCAIGVASHHQHRSALSIAIAGMLFVFSDSIIATDRFLYAFEWSPLLILGTYWLSITLLTNALPAFLKQLPD